MDTTAYFKEQFDQLQSADKESSLSAIRQQAFDSFVKTGIPSLRNEEWKYTRISGVFNKDYHYSFDKATTSLDKNDLKNIRLPDHEKASELIFINGLFSFTLSSIRSEGLVVLPLDQAFQGEYRDIVLKHLWHSNNYLKDGINALSTALLNGGIFVYVKKTHEQEEPVYVYNITDARSQHIFSQPRSLIYISEGAKLQLAETFSTIGLHDNFTNQVMEIAVEKDAILEYYKIQNDAAHSSQVSTTHIRQIGKSYTHSVTISLNGGIVRNNLNVILDAAHNEAHLYGLYFPTGDTHIDNHTIVDNAQPNCLSNELYKGIMDGNATGVFNGKIFVQRDAQKTNAYQSNKNILLTETASVNTKPQLEIFADDVKCSHGCTVGQLDEEGLFYLQSRGINERKAKSLLLYGFAIDILDKIKSASIRNYVERLIAERLEIENL
jgi:Fe-S cluster assembly protein SufD